MQHHCRFRFFFFFYSLSSAGHVTSTTTSTRNHYTPSIGLCTTHLDRVKTFVRGVQRDFPEGPFPETRNFFVPVHPLLARFRVLPFDEDRRADRRHGGRKLDRRLNPSPARRGASAPAHIVFCDDRSRRSPPPRLSVGGFEEWWAESRNSTVAVFGRGGTRSRGTIYLILCSFKAGCCSCFLLS